MILRVAVRSLATRPLRTAVLAVGFGLGIAVMAELLGVGQVILEQAHAPALQGGGDLVVTGAIGPVQSARFLLTHVLASDRFRARTRVASPSRRANLYLIAKDGAVPVAVRGGIPSLENAVGDPEVARQAGWTDELTDAQWTNPPPGDVLRAMDRFHPVPVSVPSGTPSSVASGFLVPPKPRSGDDGLVTPKPRSGDDGLVTPKPRSGEGGSRTSWAEWLYFNGRSADGGLRFYLTFLAGGTNASGTRPAFVRLQLNRRGRTTNYVASADVDARELLERAPDIDVAGNRVRLEGLRYRIGLSLQRERGSESRISNPESRVEGEITLDAAPGRSLPPAAIHGAHGWVSGYVVPVLAGTFHGTLRIDGEDVAVDGASGYHDHNWGFWEGVRWQWGQVAHGDLSIVYGRVFPPSSVADPERIPGFLAVLGKEGPIAFSTDVSIQETDDDGSPRTIAVQARGRHLEVDLAFDVSESVRTRLSMTRGEGAAAMGFLQLGGVYRVSGRAGGRELSFTSRGSAETFRY